MKTTIYCLLFFILISNGNCQQSNTQKDLQITYIANEGFLISCDNKKILIDALFKSKGYTSPSDSLISKFLSNAAPVDNINYFLVTHAHQDHFDSKMTVDFLSKNSKTKFISTSESCNKLNEIGFNSSQLICQNLELGEIKEINEIKDGQFSVSAFRLKHGTSTEINNLAYIIKINDYSIMHMGDAFVLQNEEYINKINWGDYKIDVLFVGYMDVNQFVLETLSKTIKPKYLIMMHINEEDIQEAKNRNEKYSANAIIFEKELDTKIFNK
ncbi:MAG: MBL fold metallo-hydrolase [Ignavibacteriae bacterium]|nr:MBL fold metallo-hydrolase [Ignavibacteriota bacterium]